MTRTSPLLAEHRRLGARLIEFGGWEMPLQYRGVVSEHLAVRERAGVFDVSHLGKLIIEGAKAVEVLDALLPGKVAGLSDWKAGYNLLLTEAGGIVDDVFVYRRPEKLIVVPNAANTETVLEVLRGAGAQAIDARERWAIVALQGPASRGIMAGLRADANDLPLHSFFDHEIGGIPAQVARTGYTGEYGFELFVGWDDAPALWRHVLKVGEPHGLVPAGLGARDTLRLEMGYPLHGNDISPDTNPLEAMLGWVIDWNKPSFIGRKSLDRIRTQDPTRKLVGLVAHGREIPRAHYSVFHDDKRVGEVTSGNYSPVLQKGIALAFVAPQAAEPGTMLSVDVRGRALTVEVTKPPFVKRR